MALAFGIGGRWRVGEEWMGLDDEWVGLEEERVGLGDEWTGLGEEKTNLTLTHGETLTHGGPR